jgi:hypothetical protein
MEEHDNDGEEEIANDSKSFFFTHCFSGRKTPTTTLCLFLCCQFITLKLSDNENLTIVNIYAVRTSNERALMWKRLSDASFDTAHVIIGGNFNHLEETDRRGKVGERFMLRR